MNRSFQHASRNDNPLNLNRGLLNNFPEPHFTQNLPHAIITLCSASIHSRLWITRHFIEGQNAREFGDLSGTGFLINTSRRAAHTRR
jgi:hypothetical protein